MNIQQLQFAVVTSETLSFCRSASILYTSRQNVSQAIRTLESELGTEIFSRRGNNLLLTQDGRMFIDRARGILDSFDALQRDFTVRDAEDSFLDFAFDIGFFTNNGDSNYLLKTIDDYSDTRSGCKIRILENLSSSCYELVLRRSIDLCLILGMPRTFPDCEVHELFRWPLGVMVSEKNPLAHKKMFEISDFSGKDILFPPGFEFKYLPLIQECRREGINLKPFHTINEGWEAVEGVRKSQSIMIADAREDEAARKKGTKVIPLNCEQKSACLYLIFRKDSRRKKQITHFLSYLQKRKAWDKQYLCTGFDRTIGSTETD